MIVASVRAVADCAIKILLGLVYIHSVRVCHQIQLGLIDQQIIYGDPVEYRKSEQRKKQQSESDVEIGRKDKTCGEPFGKE